jgi:predicted Rossmann-fold nucleotide-binding protein
MSIRVVVTGGRDFTEADFVYQQLNRIGKLVGGFRRLSHGGAEGVDTIAGTWAIAHGVQCAEYRANWKEHGRAAGPMRNRLMLEEERPDLVIAFPGGRGTHDCTKQAQSLGLTVIKIPAP